MNASSLSGLSPLQRRKRTAILDGAKTVFLSQGFGLATMDDVAATHAHTEEMTAQLAQLESQVTSAPRVAPLAHCVVNAMTSLFPGS